MTIPSLEEAIMVKKSYCKHNVMFKFDDDEPYRICQLAEGYGFNITLEFGSIIFEKDGKKLTLYLEEV